jgi:hypothetical protein
MGWPVCPADRLGLPVDAANAMTGRHGVVKHQGAGAAERVEHDAALRTSGGDAPQRDVDRQFYQHLTALPN